MRKTKRQRERERERERERIIKSEQEKKTIEGNKEIGTLTG